MLVYLYHVHIHLDICTYAFKYAPALTTGAALGTGTDFLARATGATLASTGA